MEEIFKKYKEKVQSKVDLWPMLRTPKKSWRERLKMIQKDSKEYRDENKPFY